MRLPRVLAVLLLLLACPLAFAAGPLDTLFKEYDEAWLALNPHNATSRGDARYDDVLEDGISEAWLARDEALARGFLARLLEIDRAALEPRAQVSYDTFRFSLELRRDGYAGGFLRKQELMPISQFNGLHLDLAQMGSGSGVQPLATAEQHQRWLKRLDQWPAWVDSAIANMRRGIESGVVLPRALAERVLPQLSAHVVDDAQKSVFWGAVAKIPAGSEHDTLVEEYRSTITTKVVPAYRKLHAFMQDEYLPKARATVARSALPDGGRWYALDIRQHTTLARSPEQIHALGLEQVALLHAEMAKVQKQLGYAGDMKTFFAELRADKRWLHPDEEAALAAYRNLKDTVRARLPQVFGRLPKADFEIRPVEAFRAASAAGGSYQRPDAAGTRPGRFYLNTYDLTRIPIYETTGLLLHEAEPGHHFQNALAIETTDLPGFQRFGWLPAYGEGWALYAETLGREMKLYDDPAQYFGFLSNRLFRACRLVIDTGLHSKGWTRERAIQYFLDNSPTSEADARAETERYISWPGQALAYLSGALEIQRLREQAGAKLGPRFDLRDFHDEVLRDGIVPMPVLEMKIERWTTARGIDAAAPR